MSYSKKVETTIVLNLVPLLAFCSITLVKLSDRPGHGSLLNEEIKNAIRANVGNDTSEEAIIRFSLSLTAELLELSEKNAVRQGKANCVGYAQLYSDICNYGFRISHKANCRAHAVVGLAKVHGININTIATHLIPWRKNFFKDHDFVEISTPTMHLFIDPSAYDVLGNPLRQELDD
jgi:hypothetical protein